MIFFKKIFTACCTTRKTPWMGQSILSMQKDCSAQENISLSVVVGVAAVFSPLKLLYIAFFTFYLFQFHWSTKLQCIIFRYVTRYSCMYVGHTYTLNEKRNRRMKHCGSFIYAKQTELYQWKNRHELCAVFLSQSAL